MNKEVRKNKREHLVSSCDSPRSSIRNWGRVGGVEGAISQYNPHINFR